MMMMMMMRSSEEEACGVGETLMASKISTFSREIRNCSNPKKCLKRRNQEKSGIVEAEEPSAVHGPIVYKGRISRPIVYRVE